MSYSDVQSYQPHPLPDDNLINLDPHFSQPSCSQISTDVNLSVRVTYECVCVFISLCTHVQSYHCLTIRKLPASKMDPSCTVGFYCRDIEEFHSLCAHTEPVNTPDIFLSFCGCDLCLSCRCWPLPSNVPCTHSSPLPRDVRTLCWIALSTWSLEPHEVATRPVLMALGRRGRSLLWWTVRCHPAM